MNKKNFLVDLKQSIGDKAPWENYVSQTDYEKFESYVGSSDLALFQVIAMGELYLNIFKNGEVERCNRLAILTGLGDDKTIKYYVYISGRDALQPPQVGDIVDAKLHFIHIDESNPNHEFYYAESITPINANVVFNYVDNEYR